MQSITRSTAVFLVVFAGACSPAADTQSDSMATTSADTATRPANPSSDTSDYSMLTVRGLGPVIVGMTIAEASTAAGSSLTSSDSIPGSTCKYLRWPNGPDGVLLMALDGRIARIDIVEPTVSTTEGIRVGATSDAVREAYAGQVAETPHKYTNGTYLTVTPWAAADSSYRMVFETDSGKVTRFRAGLLPAVQWVEGCS